MAGCYVLLFEAQLTVYCSTTTTMSTPRLYSYPRPRIGKQQSARHSFCIRWSRAGAHLNEDSTAIFFIYRPVSFHRSARLLTIWPAPELPTSSSLGITTLSSCQFHYRRVYKTASCQHELCSLYLLPCRWYSSEVSRWSWYKLAVVAKRGWYESTKGRLS